MRHFLFLLVIFPLSLSAQSKIGAYLGANFPSASDPFATGDVLAEYWHPAISVGAYYEFPLFSWVELSPFIEYNHYIFDEFHNTVTPPEPKESSGQVSRVLRVMGEIRLLDRAANGNSAYLVTGFGYVVEKPGQINVQWVPGSAEESSSTIQFTGKDYWVQSLGIGYQFDVSEYMAVDLCAKYYSNYRDRFAISTNVGIVFSLER